MAFRVVRERKKARQLAKLEELFEKYDKNKNERITIDQLRDIFRIYNVDLDDDAAAEIIDDNGEITKEDFIKFGEKAKLTDFASAGGALGGPKKEVKETKSNETTERKVSKKPESSGSLLCCCAAKEIENNPEEISRDDQIEVAFKKFDLDGDGYLSWAEFQKMTKSMGPEQAKRFFRCGDVGGDGRISLEEFRRMADMQQAG